MLINASIESKVYKKQGIQQKTPVCVVGVVFVVVVVSANVTSVATPTTGGII